MAATDERAIHEFPTGTIDDNSLLIMDRPTSTPGEYETEKFAIANLGLKLLGGIDFPSNLDTDEQDIFGAINEVNTKAMNIATEYDETASYSKGDYCIFQNAAYRCIKASGTTTGSFVAADWTQIKTLDEIQSNTTAIAQNTQDIAGKQDSFTMKTLSASDIFTNTSNISQFYGYQIGKLICIVRMVVSGGSVSGDEIRYAYPKTAYTPTASVRYLWDKGGSGTMVRGFFDPTNGIVIKDTDNTQTNFATTFCYLIA